MSDTGSKVGEARDPTWSVQAIESLTRRVDTPRVATILHWSSLAAAFVVLVVVNRHQWFQTDEWNFLVDREVVGNDDNHGIWDAHNEHWYTLTVVAYRGLFVVFGVQTYLPYLLMMILVQLLTVHLLWRLLRRMGVDLLLATCGCAVFAVFGAGWENLTQAFQVSFIAPITAGLAALLVLPEEGPFQRRDVAAWGLGLVALMSAAGVGLVVVGVIGLFTLLGRGVRSAIVVVAVPAIAYAAWYLVYGPGDGAPGQSTSQGIADAPAFAWRGLVDAMDSTTGLAGIGAVVLVIVFVWTVRAARPQEWAWQVALSTAAGAVVFLLLVSVGRSGFGLQVAGSARYTYVVVALLMPLLLLAIDRGLRGTPLRVVVLLGVTALLLLVQVRELRSQANASAELEQEQKRRIVATAQLLADGEPVIFSVPVPIFIPNLSTDEIASLDADGLLPGNVEPAEEDVLTARIYTQLVVGDAPAVEGTNRPTVGAAHGAQVELLAGGDCVVVVPMSDAPSVDLRFTGPGSVEVTTSRTGQLAAQVREAGTSGPYSAARVFPVVGGQESYVSFATGGFVVVLGIPPDGQTELCGVDVASDIGAAT